MLNDAAAGSLKPTCKVVPFPSRTQLPILPLENMVHLHRLGDRVIGHGTASMSDHDILESMLLGAVPKRELTVLVENLFHTFGSINYILAACPGRLSQIEGINPLIVAQIKVMEALGHRMARARVMLKPLLTSWSDVLLYLKTAMAHQSVEKFRVLYLDTKNFLIADEEMASGTVDFVPVYPREIVKRAIALNAMAVILVHNHPSGDPTPSDKDIEMTISIENTLKAVDIVLHDHLIIGCSQETSFRSLGLL